MLAAICLLVTSESLHYILLALYPTYKLLSLLWQFAFSQKLQFYIQGARMKMYLAVLWILVFGTDSTNGTQYQYFTYFIKVSKHKHSIMQSRAASENTSHPTLIIFKHYKEHLDQVFFLYQFLSKMCCISLFQKDREGRSENRHGG